MKINLDCPNAYHADGMKVYCRKLNGLCGSQYFKRCKGWWVLTENARNCPLRKENENA